MVQRCPRDFGRCSSEAEQGSHKPHFGLTPLRRAKQWVAQNPREAVGASQTAGYLPAGLPVEAVVKATAEMGFGIPLDLEKALERSIQDRIASGAIKTDKTAKELVRLHYRKIE